MLNALLKQGLYLVFLQFDSHRFFYFLMDLMDLFLGQGDFVWGLDFFVGQLRMLG